MKNRKIKVLRIINRFNLGGPTYNAAYLTKYLDQEFETLLIGGQKDASEESSEFILQNLGIKPVVVPEMRRSVSFKEDKQAYKKIKDIMEEYRPDIVHTHASKAGALGRLAAAKCDVPIVVHTFHGHVFHSYFGKWKTLFYKNVERYLAKKTNKIIAISAIQKEELFSVHKICKEDKISVVPLGFDLQKFQDNIEEKREAFRKYYKLDDDTVAIGIIGRLVPIKNHAFFIDAIKRVKEKSTKKVRAFIVGDGEEKNELIAYIKRNGIDFTEWEKEAKPATITFTSWIKDIDRVNAGMDIIALTSLNEGTPVSLIEAQAANKPIVTTNVGGIENIVKKDETAFVTDVGDKNGFSHNLLNLVENKDLRIQMGAKGWEFVNRKFHFRRLAKDTADLYRELINKI